MTRVQVVGVVSNPVSLSPPAVSRVNGHAKLERRHDVGGYESSSTLMSSELESTSFFDSEEDDSASRYGTC
ncbi:UNVERIFIED_CONTAM: hypothetical protein FKN15_056253 [Acipenser sinensis]